MKLKYTPKAPSTPSIFVVKFKYEHGDADTTTYFEKIVNLKEKEFIEYLEKVNMCAQDIDDARAYGTELPDGFQEGQNCHGVNIPIEYDCHYQDDSANISVSRITYIDVDGVEFDVTQEQT